MKRKAQSGLGIFLLVCLLLGGLIFLFFVVSEGDFSNSDSITGNVVKTIKNCRDIQVSYLVEENYDYYLQNIAISRNQNEKLELFGKGIYNEGTINLKNVDNEAGWFIVTFNWKTLNNEREDKIRHYIDPDETIEFKSIYDNDAGEDIKFTFTAKSEPIQKTRTITKYRTEEKCD